MPITTNSHSEESKKIILETRGKRYEEKRGYRKPEYHFNCDFCGGEWDCWDYDIFVDFIRSYCPYCYKEETLPFN